LREYRTFVQEFVDDEQGSEDSRWEFDRVGVRAYSG